MKFNTYSGNPLVGFVNNSHLGKNTFIISDMIYNGCQAFHINELDKVCFENGVSVIDKNDLLSLYYQIKEDTKDDREALLESLYYDENANKFLSSNECCFSTAKALIAQGIHIDDYMRRASKVFKVYIAQSGFKLDELVYDENIQVCTMVIEYIVDNIDNGIVCTNILDILVNDSSAVVRRTLALTKYKKYLDILVNDANTKVRVNVALSGIKDYLDILVNDYHWEVLRIAALLGNERHLDLLIKHSSPVVLQTIAKRGISKYTQILKKHYNLNIRQFVLDVQNLNV